MLYLKFGLYRILVYSGFGLYRILVYSGFGLYRVLVYSGFGLDRFIQDSGLDRFIQDSGLFRVWFRQVSPYIHNESKLTKERKKNHGDKRLLTPFEGFFLLPQGEIIDKSMKILSCNWPPTIPPHKLFIHKIRDHKSLPTSILDCSTFHSGVMPLELQRLYFKNLSTRKSFEMY